MAQDVLQAGQGLAVRRMLEGHGPEASSWRP
jgi:hypothetical protein